ncbi:MULTISPECIES: TPM domain-containing protein [Chitinophagaceae]
MRRYILLLLLLCNSWLASFAQYTIKTIPDPKKNGQQYYISNPDYVLDDHSVDQLNTICKSLDDASKAEVAIVAINDYKGNKEIFDFAMDLFRYWHIGKKGTNSGLLLLIVKDKRKYQFITGYGLEGNLTDYQLSAIGRNSLVPYFKNGQYGAGAVNALERISDQLGISMALPMDDSNVTVPAPPDYSLPDEAIDASTGMQESHGILSKPNHRLWLSDKTNQYILAAILFLMYIFSDIWMQKIYKTKRSLIDNAKTIALYVFSGIFVIGFPIIFTGGLITALPMVIIQGCIIGYIRFSKGFTQKENEYLDVVNKYNNVTNWTRKNWFVLLITPILWFKLLSVLAYRRLAKKTNAAPEGAEDYTRLNWDDDYNSIRPMLSKGEIKENELNANIYQVWENMNTHDKKVLQYKGLHHRSYCECSACHAWTMPVTYTVKIISKATYSHSGKGEKIRRCLNCNNIVSDGFIVLPRLQESSSSSSGSSWSSSSSSSSGSWGGGSSGGGGAGGSW